MKLRSPWALVGVCLLGAISLVQAGVLAAGFWRDAARARELSEFNRGKAVAERLGCFSCHGADGLGGTVNLVPGFDEVPSFERASFDRYCRSPAELEQWILDGMPERFRDSPGELERVQNQLIRMPAFRGQVEGAALADLLRYVRTVAGAANPPANSAALAGQAVAEKFGCFGCHGPEGRAMAANAGSFKGYIPAWDSDDFSDLVRSPEEFSGWILKGAPARLRDNPVAAHFLEAQRTKMPAYGAYLDQEEVSQLWAYVQWVRQPSPAPRAP